MPRRVVLRFGTAVAAELLLFAALNFFDDWSLKWMPVKFVALALACGIAYLFAVSSFASLDRPSARPPSARWPLRKYVPAIFWIVAVGLRLIALPMAPGDDIWRYQWEGRIQNAGFNPYVSGPAAPELAPLRKEFPNWAHINHREFRAIYPPGTEIVFALMSRITSGLLPYKILFMLADLATIAILLRLLGKTERLALAACYAWNPLVAYSFAGAAHFDSLMLLPMVGALFFLERHETSTGKGRRWLLAFAAATALGGAISIKLVPGLLLLAFAFALGLRAVALMVSAMIPALLALFYGFPKIRIWDSLGDFIYITRLNDLFWWMVEETFWPNPDQKNYHYNVIILAVVVVVSVLFYRNWKRGVLWALGSALILSPVFHPWYCTWILPVATWRRAYAWHVLSVTLFAYYLFWSPQLFAVPWQSELWQRALIIIPPLLCAIFLAERARRAGPAAEPAILRG